MSGLAGSSRGHGLMYLRDCEFIAIVVFILLCVCGLVSWAIYGGMRCRNEYESGMRELHVERHRSDAFLRSSLEVLVSDDIVRWRSQFPASEVYRVWLPLSVPSGDFPGVPGHVVRVLQREQELVSDGEALAALWSRCREILVSEYELQLPSGGCEIVEELGDTPVSGGR